MRPIWASSLKMSVLQSPMKSKLGQDRSTRNLTVGRKGAIHVLEGERGLSVELGRVGGNKGRKNAACAKTGEHGGLLRILWRKKKVT